MLMLIVLLAPVLMLAAGIFVGQRNAGDDTGNANPEARKTAHSAAKEHERAYSDIGRVWSAISARTPRDLCPLGEKPQAPPRPQRSCNGQRRRRQR